MMKLNKKRWAELIATQYDRMIEQECLQIFLEFISLLVCVIPHFSLERAAGILNNTVWRGG